MNNCNHADLLRTISPSVLPADYKTHVPPLSPDKGKLLPQLTTLTMGQEIDVGNIGGLLIDLAKDGSEDRTSTPTEKEAGAISHAPTENEVCTIPQATTVKQAATNLPTPVETEAGVIRLTAKEASTNPGKTLNHQQQGTPKPDQPTTSSSGCSSYDDDTEDEEYVSWYLDRLSLDPDRKRMWDGKTMMLAHHERKIGNKSVPNSQQAVNKDLELFIESEVQFAVVGYWIYEVIVPFDTQLANIPCFANCQGKRKADTDGVKRKRERKE